MTHRLAIADLSAIAMARRMWRGWRGMAVTTRRLLAARFWRSLSQGALVVDLSLYLHALGWSGVAIGGVLTAGGFFSALTSLLVGVASDRGRRKPFVIAYEGLTCLCAIAALSTADPLWLAPAIAFGGFGRGASGGAGPFSPAEQAWLAEAIELPQRGLVYSLNTCFGMVGMALGALAAALPAFWHDALGPALSYRPLFLLVLLGNAVNLVIVAGTPEIKKISQKRVPRLGSSAARPSRAVYRRSHDLPSKTRAKSWHPISILAIFSKQARERKTSVEQDDPPDRADLPQERHIGDNQSWRGVAAATPAVAKAMADTAAIHATENRFLRRLMALNALNGLAVGLIGPLIAYWFALRFHVGPGAIGPFMAITFLLTAGSALALGLASRKIGLVRSVLVGRSMGVVFLVLMPLMPVYFLAAFFYVVRSLVNRGTIGARQALVVSAVRDHRRGLAVSLNMVSMMIPMAIGPTLAGAMIGAHWFILPFYIAAALQLLYVIFYGRLFGPFEKQLNKT